MLKKFLEKISLLFNVFNKNIEIWNKILSSEFDITPKISGAIFLTLQPILTINHKVIYDLLNKPYNRNSLKMIP
jgi:hypothetical protein